MIKIQIYPVTMLDTNCCYLVDEATGKAAVSDPGECSKQLELQIENDGGKLEYVLLTHGHYDHICYAKQLADKYGAKVVTGSHNDIFLSDTHINGTREHRIPYKPFKADILLEDGDTFRLGDTEIKYLYTPGHTSGCGIFVFDDIIIAGDLIFCESYGRTDLPTGDEYEMIKSLKRVKELEGDYTIIPGHGPLTSLEHERKYNPLMRRL